MPEPVPRHRWVDVEVAEGHAGPPSKEEVLGKLLKELDLGTAQQLLAAVEVQAAREADGVRPKGKAQWEKGPWDLGKATSSPEWRATAQPRGPKEPRWLCSRSGCGYKHNWACRTHCLHCGGAESRRAARAAVVEAGGESYPGRASGAVRGAVDELARMLDGTSP